MRSAESERHRRVLRYCSFMRIYWRKVVKQRLNCSIEVYDADAECRGYPGVSAQCGHARRELLGGWRIVGIRIPRSTYLSPRLYDAVHSIYACISTSPESCILLLIEHFWKLLRSIRMRQPRDERCSARGECAAQGEVSRHSHRSMYLKP